MRRTELLQEVRKMRFEEAYGGWQERRLTQEEAARMLGVCERTFRRYVDRYEEEGLDGLVDKRLGQVSARQAPVDEVMRTEALYRERYEGVEREALPQFLPSRARGEAQLHVGEEHASACRAGGEGAGSGQAPSAPGASAACGDDAAPGRFDP